MSFLKSSIFICGGFDGKNAVNLIECYSINEDHWSILNLKLPNYLSNCQSFSVNSKTILIFGKKYFN